jgi:hypothetical protein
MKDGRKNGKGVKGEKGKRENKFFSLSPLTPFPFPLFFFGYRLARTVT